ncbi:uncharacterized protein LOC133294534 isoform X3 [Gastrolobium bilobum]|uniref:uncharacterized protein LOC133294534 isoform X3 n=1 Tax=Gastrolobium bilobum TaxID=150636 RepID=UPI002AB02821|nr:uncharacterized protein LOC133294534 isoform X3 [Gastrolobium bilobum]
MAMSVDLNDVSDFEALASDVYISICGYGSLLSETSARSTFPDLVNFRIAKLTGFRRVFTAVGGFFFTHAVANIKTEEIAGLSVEPCEGETILVTVFEIKKTEIPAFIEREREYRFLAVIPESLDGKSFANPAVLCASCTDEDFFKFRCSVSWPQKALVMKLTITFWIIASLLTVKQPYVST